MAKPFSKGREWLLAVAAPSTQASTDTLFSSALWRWKSLKRKRGKKPQTNQLPSCLKIYWAGDIEPHCWHSTLAHAFPWPEPSPKDGNSSMNTPSITFSADLRFWGHLLTQWSKQCHCLRQHCPSSSPSLGVAEYFMGHSLSSLALSLGRGVKNSGSP